MKTFSFDWYSFRWTAVFLGTTALTSLTGCLFPFMGTTPVIKLEIVSLVLVAITIVTRYPLAACVAENLRDHCRRGVATQGFRTVVQSFEKAPIEGYCAERGKSGAGSITL